MTVVRVLFSLGLATLPSVISAFSCASDNRSCAGDEMLAMQIQHKHATGSTHVISHTNSDCSDGDVVDGLLCYPKCKSGYTGVGPVCWQTCPAGFTNDGAFCAKPSPSGRGFGYAAWHEDECNQQNSGNCVECLLMWYPSCANDYHAVGCNICSPNCPDDMVDIGESCTKKTYGRTAGVPTKQAIKDWDGLVSTMKSFANRVLNNGTLFEIGMRVANAWTIANAPSSQSEFFPEANAQGSKLSYLFDSTNVKGSHLSKYSQLMLAFIVQGYTYDTSGTETNTLSQPITADLLYGKKTPASSFCTPPSTSKAIQWTPVWTLWSDNLQDPLGPNTVSFLFTYEAEDEQLLVLNFRGSESPLNILHLHSESDLPTAETIDEIVQNWFGTDADVTPMADGICDGPGVKTHAGWQKAWLTVRETVKQKVNTHLASMAADSSKPIKFFITGHSLGAGVAVMATYDLWCKHWLDSAIIPFERYPDQVFTFTAGQPIAFWQSASVQYYQSVVPVTNRLRLQTIGQKTGKDLLGESIDFWDGDMITIDFVGSSPPMYLQPSDGDYQAALINSVPLGPTMRNSWGASSLEANCFGGMPLPSWLSFIQPVFCHLLDRYLQGIGNNVALNDARLCNPMPAGWKGFGGFATLSPAHASCSENSDCSSDACGRLSAGDDASLVCCPSGKVDSYGGFSYCTDQGTACLSDAMCASGACVPHVMLCVPVSVS